ncbi:MAG: adenylyltransferase/cytidyltransferase family protein [Nitrospira sp.]|nr:adenylyltransferase/cytidyltransferase family protein [Nitrospira sp.]MCB9710591.1 adenylyltransferase/cytidyltransferase family protein [Nitrospiraceae bacterium]MDR4486938.1 PfkB family carbohydrate kinase [Nitrospirales bacterium]
MLASLMKQYRHKIKNAEELQVAIGPRPRKKKVIMCHGVFDVVHPGHLRHLIYAKSKAPILVASLTADVHIAKGQHRPYVPQDLRALNLAAFEVVDYVLVDSEPTPLKNLLQIQPDFFAKGYEYNANGVHPKTQEELDALQSYGGKMIFTPGDIVYSSTKLIDLAPPSIKIEKLLTLMESEGITFQNLREALMNLKGKCVHVIGDTIVDSYTQTAMIGGQTKTPTMSVLFEGKTDYIGGAGVVAKHLRAAGARVIFSTVLGEDPLKEFVLEGLKESDVDCRPIIDPTRPTTNKNAIVAEGYRLLKVDTVDNRTISDEIVGELSDSISRTACDALVFSDFRHGIFNRRTIPQLIEAIPQGAYRVADSQVASRWGNITEFQGFDLITPNEREARFALADQDSGVRPLAARLFEAAKCRLLILKLGDRGVLTCRGGDHEALESYFVVDSFVERLADAVGAGDALLAYSTLTMVATRSEVMATILGSIAAACECELDGNIPIRPEDVMKKIDAAERMAHYQ